ncbi:MAG: Lrp/AsnC family transcriptional regulator [Pseudomonadota bacterium]
MKLDFVDIKILEILQLNARAPISEIAKSVGVAPSTAQNRVRALETAGVIEYYSAVVALDHVATFVEVFVRVTLNDHSAEANEDFQNHIWKMPEVIGCFLISAASEYLMHVLVSDTSELRSIVIDKLSQLPQVDTVSTELVLDAVKTDYLLPLRSLVGAQARA